MSVIAILISKKKDVRKMFYITGDTHGDFSRYIPFTAWAKPAK